MTLTNELVANTQEIPWYLCSERETFKTKQWGVGRLSPGRHHVLEPRLTPRYRTGLT